MKHSNTRTLKNLITKQQLISTGILILVLTAVSLLAWYCSDNAFWNHLSAQ
jgi:hypothetical protein